MAPPFFKPHPSSYFLLSIFVLDKILFTQTLTSTPHLSLGGLSKVVYEHL
jgi:hypothetical protein